MAIERKPATPIDGLIEQEPEEELTIEIENPESVAIDTDDGGPSSNSNQHNNSRDIYFDLGKP